MYEALLDANEIIVFVISMQNNSNVVKSENGANLYIVYIKIVLFKN